MRYEGQISTDKNRWLPIAPSSVGAHRTVLFMIRQPSKIAATRTFVPWGHSLRFELHAELESAAELTTLADTVMSAVVTPHLATPTITDVRGRTDTELLLPSELTLRGEELFAIAGTVVASGAINRREHDERFVTRVVTRFQDFAEPHHILHTTHTEREGTLPAELSIERIARAVPIELSYLRCGLECFRSRRFTGLLGFAPTVWATASLECSLCELSIRVEMEGQKDTAWHPERLPESIRALLAAVEEG